MSNLPGNPHAENVEVVLMQTVLSSDDSGTQTIESLLMDNANATLALAYEQRTANLIAVATAVSENGVYQLDPALIGAAQEKLATRLGLGENND